MCFWRGVAGKKEGKTALQRLFVGAVWFRAPCLSAVIRPLPLPPKPQTRKRAIGGRGELCWELRKAGVRATLLDPRPQKGLGRTQLADMKRIRKRAAAGGPVSSAELALLAASAPAERQIVARLGRELLRSRSSFGAAGEGGENPELAALLDGASAIIALHPDEATEIAVDVAIARSLPFVVVPCCVFATQNPHRRLFPSSLPAGGGGLAAAEGRPVRTYADLLLYLRAKHPLARRVRLGFRGMNVAVCADLTC